MLPKKYRLTVPQFQSNTKRSTALSTPFFTLVMKPGDGTNPRFVFMVPKSLDKRSTRRHRSKRILEGALLKTKTSLIGRQDVLIKLKHIVAQDKRKEVIHMLFDCLKKAGLLI